MIAMKCWENLDRSYLESFADSLITSRNKLVEDVEIAFAASLTFEIGWGSIERLKRFKMKVAIKPVKQCDFSRGDSFVCGLRKAIHARRN